MLKEKPDLFQKFITVINTLNNFEVEYVVIGGVAVIIHGMPRLTQDLDIIIKMSQENIGRLRKALYSVFNDESIDDITYDEMKKYSVIRYGTEEGFFIDLMGKVGDKVEYNTVEREIKEIERVEIYIATAKSLLNMKKNSIRPEDQRDFLFLKNLIETQKE